MNLNIVVELCKRFEGFKSKPYICPAGVPTIGYGSTRYADGKSISLTDGAVTEQQAIKLLINDLSKVFAPGVRRQCPKLFADAMITGDWKKFNAIVDFAYNLGVGRLQTSTLRRKINAQDWDGAKQELMKWVRGGGRVLPGLVKRRQAECSLIN